MKIVIDIPEDNYNAIKDMPNAYDSDICKAIRNGIPYEERAQGKWILVKVNLKFIYKCSECGRTIGLTHSETLLAYPFCHCGADMRGKNK